MIFNVPLRVAAARVLLSGSLPLWNPYIFCGMPLHAAAQGGLLFPLNWFYLLFSTPVATNLMMLSTYSAAGIGALFYARRSGSDAAGSLVTAIAWQFSAFMVCQIGHTNVRSPVGSGAPRLRKAGQYRGKVDALLVWTKRNIVLRRRANFMRPVQNRSALLSVSKGVSGADVIIDRQRKSLERSVGKWLALQCRGLHRQPNR